VIEMTRRVLLVALAALLLAAIALTACAPSKEKVAEQQRQECFANEQRIKTAMDLVHADTGFYPNVSDAADKLGLKCPAGGTYVFDPNTDTVSCSVHGRP
jgi:hypothetical protein